MTLDRSSGRATVLLVESESIVCAALRHVLGQELGFHVVVEPDVDVDVAETIANLRPDIVVVNAEYGAAGGVELCALIKEANAATRVLVTSDVEEETILLDAFEAGADGYISKQSPLVDLFEATRTVARGEAWVPPAMVGVVLRRLITRRRREDAALQRFTRLSRREVEVLDQLAKGQDQDAIAATLFISPETARTHIQNIITKLGVHSRQDAVAQVREFELLERFSEGGGKRRDAR